jgi:polar amino acid transport system substrate-binding protein
MTWPVVRLVLQSILVLSISTIAEVVSAEDGPAALPPLLVDPAKRLERPDLRQIRTIRFLTEEDYPPFNFLGPDGQLTGFNVDLARAICAELKVTCTIQSRRWDNLLDALEQNRGDAVIASLAVTPALRQRFAFTMPYYRTPARFLERRDATPATADLVPSSLAGKRVAVVTDTAHAAFLGTFFPTAHAVPVADPDLAKRALRRGDVDYVFGDGVHLALWLNGAEAEGCCRFAGGPFLDSRYFGEGAAIAVQPANTTLRAALDYALARLSISGTHSDLLLKYFPVSFY